LKLLRFAQWRGDFVSYCRSDFLSTNSAGAF
jgi:hypothetical protein